MATIEPRLIHLLNESTSTPRPSHAELPPIKVLPYPNKTPSNRLHPIDPDVGQRSESTETGGGGPPNLQSIPSFYSVSDDIPRSATAKRSLRKDVGGGHNASTDRPLLNHVSSQDLRMILDDTPEIVEDQSTKKRPVKEDYPQLPQPLKKQKAAAQTHMFPPIIVGLQEPPSAPSNARLFPPISSGSFGDRPRSEPPPQAPSIGTISIDTTQALVTEDATVPSPPADSDRTHAFHASGKVKRRAAKPRRKWSEEETNHLLLGVSKHGVGRWTDILEDPEYRFNDRTAGDLKDRFRTCCPAELRASSAAKLEAGQNYPEEKDSPKNASTRPTRGNRGGRVDRSRPKKGLMSENILNEEEEDDDAEGEEEDIAFEQHALSLSVPNSHDDGGSGDSSTSRPRKSRAHRKKMEDLAELGIRGPFRKSLRRERRPFSEQDDREILEGFETYGPQWTKIQRDPRFHLSARQPTDLRDRLRNKYPEKFTSTEKTTMQVREQPPVITSRGSANNLLEPYVNMEIENSLNVSKSALLEPGHLVRSNSKDDIHHKWPLPPIEGTSGPAELSCLQQTHLGPLYWNDPVVGAGGGTLPPGAIGEMDISRLLLDDAQSVSDPPSSEKRGYG